MATCNHDGKLYDELDVFVDGVNGCAKCICVDSQIYCNKTNCKDIKSATKITMTSHRERDANEKYSINEINAEKIPGEIPPSENDIVHPGNVYLQRFKNGYRRRMNYE